MSYIGENSDFEQCPGDSINQHNQHGGTSGFKSKIALSTKSSTDPIWSHNDRKNYKSDDSYSEMSDTDNFLAKGAFLITPSHELTIDRAAVICEKMNFKGFFRFVNVLKCHRDSKIIVIFF